MKKILHKALSMLLTAAMVLNRGLIPVFAEGTNSPDTTPISHSPRPQALQSAG